MLIAEDLLLLVLDDERGSFRTGAAQRGPALAGAVLDDLLLAGRLAPEGGAQAPPRAPLRVVDASPTGDDVLDAALAVAVRRGPVRPERLLRPVGKGLQERLLARLVASGALTERQVRVLGLFPVRRYPVSDPAHGRRVLAAVAAELRGIPASDPRVPALTALLGASGALRRVLAPEDLGMTRRELRAASRAAVGRDRVATAVRRAVQSSEAAAG